LLLAYQIERGSDKNIYTLLKFLYRFFNFVNSILKHILVNACFVPVWPRDERLPFVNYPKPSDWNFSWNNKEICDNDYGTLWPYNPLHPFKDILREGPNASPYEPGHHNPNILNTIVMVLDISYEQRLFRFNLWS